MAANGDGTGAELVTFHCPVCGRTSYNPNDVRYRWCGNCHGLTADEPPAGFQWVLFETVDPRERFGRLIEEHRLVEGSVYTLIITGTFVYTGGRFVPALT